MRTRLLRYVGAGVVLVSLGGTAIGCRQAPATSPSADAIATPSSGPSPTPEVVYSSWIAIAVAEPLPHTYGGSEVRAVVAFGDGYVAIGGVNGGCCTGGFTHDTHGVVWTSADGSTWELEPADAAFDLGRPIALATDGSRLVAVGARMLPSVTTPGDAEAHGAAWTSGDGRTWAVVTEVPDFTSVVAFGGAFLAAASGSAGPEIWRSLDGTAWTKVAGVADLGPGTIADMAVSGSGIVAVGRTDLVGAATSTAVTWRSDDGSHWTRAADQAGMGGAGMAHVATSRGRLVAVGNGDTLGALWWSDDGVTWTRALDSPMGDPVTTVSDVVAGDGGFVVIGSRSGSPEPNPMLWTSRDGRSWTAVELPDRLETDRLAAVQAGDVLLVFARQWLADGARAIPVGFSVR